MKIQHVQAGSTAETLGIRTGENLVTINGKRVRDILDYHFHVADGDLEVVVQSPTGDSRSLRAALNPGEDLGLGFDEMKTRLCGNECVFCFIDQMPKGMRPTLYVKDEDYRLSFLHGNFVTLTNMKQWELDRIVEQRLSPIYVSVHSTNPETRRRLLKPKVDRDILQLIDFLAQNGITLHTQIVLCPGYNDGEDLQGTIGDLAARWPGVQSLAIVPLGMTDHREGLVDLAPITVEAARAVLDQVLPHQKRFRKLLGSTFVYLADEFYRLLALEPPPHSHYDGFPQLENGIGMTRHFIARIGRTRRLFGAPARRGERRFTLVTGELFEPILRRIVTGRLERTGEDVEVQIVGCENRFFGRSVTVAGLLTYGDIERALRGRDLGDRVFVPPATLNGDRVFLDDRSLDELARTLSVPVEAGFFRT